MSSRVLEAKQKESGKWAVKVNREGSERILLVNHVGKLGGQMICIVSVFNQKYTF